jgi:hypothetical protein
MRVVSVLETRLVSMDLFAGRIVALMLVRVAQRRLVVTVQRVTLLTPN